MGAAAPLASWLSSKISLVYLGQYYRQAAARECGPAWLQRFCTEL